MTTPHETKLKLRMTRYFRVVGFSIEDAILTMDEKSGLEAERIRELDRKLIRSIADLTMARDLIAQYLATYHS